MQIKLTTDYAMRMINYLSEMKTVVPASEMTEKMNIPKEYAQSIGRKLKKAGYVDITLGAFGGLKLIKKPEEITIYEIVLLMERSIKLSRCLDDEKQCNRSAASFCPLHTYFNKLQDKIEQDMKSVTFADFL